MYVEGSLTQGPHDIHLGKLLPERPGCLDVMNTVRPRPDLVLAVKAFEGPRSQRSRVADREDGQREKGQQRAAEHRRYGERHQGHW